jgi:hypothetical protein
MTADVFNLGVPPKTRRSLGEHLKAVPLQAVSNNFGDIDLPPADGRLLDRGGPERSPQAIAFGCRPDQASPAQPGEREPGRQPRCCGTIAPNACYEPNTIALRTPCDNIQLEGVSAFQWFRQP